MKVTAMVSTKDRYHTTLPACLISMVNQTYKPYEILIYDDGAQEDLRKDSLYQNIFSYIQVSGIKWKMIFGRRVGQVANHQASIRDAEGDFIWRLDDDNMAEPTCLENLVKEMAEEGVGAVGGLVLDPKGLQDYNPHASNKMKDIYLGLNIQWFRKTPRTEVDHLYSTFLYRKSAAGHGYPSNLSKVGHREESIFTYEMKRRGWKIIVTPEAVTWHFRESTGGIRSFGEKELWDRDEEVFKGLMKEWGLESGDYEKHIVLDAGIGDHIVFLKVLPDIKKRYPNARLSIYNCYPELFEDHKDVILRSIQDAYNKFVNIDHFNIYKWMWDRGWNRSLEDAFRGMYKCEK